MKSGIFSYPSGRPDSGRPLSANNHRTGRRFSKPLFFGLLLAVAACRGPEYVLPAESEQQGQAVVSEVLGFYLLNEGNMGTNKATLDYYDFAAATYTRNIYSQANPEMAQSLGDVGNDLRIYGSKMYAVINCSNFVEVMDAVTARHLGTLEVPNCRHLDFCDGYGYLTSYAGPVVVDATQAQIGYVARFDTATLRVLDTVHVGFQPDELAVVGRKLYVANSGGYMVPNYENTVSVIDLDEWALVASIPVACNLQRVCADAYGQLWVSSRGDYYGQPSRLYCVDTKTDRVTDSVLTAVGSMWLDGDSLYVCASAFSFETMNLENSFSVVDVRTHQQSALNLQAPSLERPYAIAVHPITKDIYLADAGNCVTPGTLYCFAPDGPLQWSVRTGDVPAHVAFLLTFK